MLRHQKRAADAGMQSNESWQYRVLMAIPRNLVYVFACVIVFAFLGMLFIVYTERDLKSFIDYDKSGGADTVIREDLVVHPLFWHLRNAIQTIDEVPRTKMSSLTTKKFY